MQNDETAQRDSQDQLVQDSQDVQDVQDSAPAAPEQIEIRRNWWISAAIGGFATLLAVAFALRAMDSGSVLDWVLLGLLAVIAVVHVAALIDSRAPLLVADDYGVRMRRGSDWTGLAWSEIECVEHLPRRAPLRDGHLLVVAANDEQHVVPLTMASRIDGTTIDEASDDLARLAAGRTDVVEVVPGLDEDEPVDDEQDSEDTVEVGRRDAAEPDADVERTAIRSTPLIDEVKSRDGQAADPADTSATPATPATPVTPDTAERPVTGPSAADDVATGELDAVDDRPKDTDHPSGPGPSTDETGSMSESATAVPARGGRARMLTSLIHRRSGRLVSGGDTIGATALQRDVEPDELPEVEQLQRVDIDENEQWTLAGVRVIESDPLPAESAKSIPSPEEDESTVVLEHLRVDPATEPVIGPQLKAARTQIRLTIDQVAERTRIRPHVIEAMESDDFGPCGGDFYARGHLRTLARILGLEAAPLLEMYDDRYSDAPPDPRRVFESELATGVGGSIRGTRGGRNWSVLIAAIMAAVLIWSVAQLLMGSPTPVGDAPVLNQSGGIDNGAATQAKSIPVTLTAVGGGAHLVVRDGGGEVVFDGNLAFGQSTKLDVAPPVRIWSSDGSVTASLDGAEAKGLGETGTEVTKTLVP